MRERLRDAPKERTHGLPVPAVGRFCFRDREGPPDYPEFGIAWPGADGEEVFARLGREGQRVAWCNAGYGPWLPTDWRMTLSPYGWTIEHLRPWFSIMKNWCGTPFAKRHDINTTPENETPDYPAPRGLVHHAYLILRHVTQMHGWEGTPAEPIGLKSEDTLGCVSQIQIVEAEIEKRLAKSAKTESSTSPQGASIATEDAPFDYLAAAQAERNRREEEELARSAAAEKEEQIANAREAFDVAIRTYLEQADSARSRSEPRPPWDAETVADLLLEIGRLVLSEEPYASALPRVSRESLLGNWNGQQERIELECALDLLKSAKVGDRERLIEILANVEIHSLWKAFRWIGGNGLWLTLRSAPPEYPNSEFPLVGEREGVEIPNGCWLSGEANTWASIWYPTEPSLESMLQWLNVSRRTEESARTQKDFDVANKCESSRAHDLAIVSRLLAQKLIPLVDSRYLTAPEGTPPHIKAAFEAIGPALVDASDIRSDPPSIEPGFRDRASWFAEAVHKAIAAYDLAMIPLQACLDFDDAKCPHEIALDTLRELNNRVGHVMLGVVPFELAVFHVRSMPAFDVNELLRAMRRQVCKAAIQAGERTASPLSTVLVAPPSETEGDLPRIPEKPFHFVPSGIGYDIKGFGESGHLDRLKGLRVIARLLRTPGKAVSMFDLANIDERARTDGKSRQEALDQEGRERLGAKLREAEADVEEARRQGNTVDEHLAATELEKLKTHLANAVGFGGADRDLNNQFNRLRPRDQWASKNRCSPRRNAER